MHISEGVLTPQVWIGGYVVAGGIAAATIRKMNTDELPKISVITSVFFVASLIHIPMGPTSVHLILIGLVGVVLGLSSFVSIFVGLTLQALLFQHGGLTPLGANACMMGIPALCAYGIFSLRKKITVKYPEAIFGALAGATAILLSGICLGTLLALSGEEFFGVAKMAVLAHIPVMIIEGAITGFTAAFLHKVKPEILEGRGLDASGY
jgi:cobalt/nickel transport system permease protein